MKAAILEERIIDVLPEQPKRTIRQRVRQASSAGRALARKAWNATDIDDRLFFLGLILIGAGLYQLRPSLSAIVVGALLVFAARPLRRWF